MSSPRDMSVQYLMDYMLKRTTNPGVVAMNPGVAKRILTEANFPRQRPVKASKVKKHMQRVANGTWRGQDFPITFARIPSNGEYQDRLWLVNGQHRLHMIAAGDASVPVRVHIADVDNEQEAAILYTYFDSPDESRNDLEVLEAVGASEDLDLPREMVRAMYGALAFLRNNLEPAYYQSKAGDAARDRAGRINDIKAWGKEAEAFWVDIKDATTFLKRKMLRPAVVAVALYTYRYQPSKAHEFWNGVARNDGLSMNDPRARFITDLITRNGNKLRLIVQAACLAWNAYCEGRNVIVIKCYPNAAIKVWGTPMANGAPKIK